MNFKNSTYIPLLFLIAIIEISFPFLHDLIIFKQINLGLIDNLFLITGIVQLIIAILGIVYKKNYKSWSQMLSTLVFTIIILAGIIPILIVSLKFETNKEFVWSIAIYEVKGKDFMHLSEENIKNPIIQAATIKGINGLFVGDPFVVKNKDSIFIFFELFERNKDKAVIAVASSKNGRDWQYKDVVLREPYHLSFPYVFLWNDTFYLIPESSKAKSINLYKSVGFPYKWQFCKTLLHGDKYCDNVLFYKNNIWYLFTSTSNSNLFLYYSDSPLGPWKSHPKNPIKSNFEDGSRMSGKIFEIDNKLIRFAQDDFPNYGNELVTYSINSMDTINYSESKIEFLPKLRGKNNYSRNGVHTASFLSTQNGYFLVVDQY